MLIKHSLYKNQLVALASKHEKQGVIANSFAKHLSATVQLASVDTDVLGTFSGEIPRQGTALEAAEKKARLGIAETNLLYGMGSEGSFGAHPWLPFLACNTEILVFIDLKHNFKLHEIVLSEKTNYNHKCVANLYEVESFLSAVKFPTHAVIIKPNQSDNRDLLFKGLQDFDAIKAAFKVVQAASTDRMVWLETDMRAHMNPSRMHIISIVAEKLALRLTKLCPECRIPGWGILRHEKGLPCVSCNQPTELTAAHIYGCAKCDHEEKIISNEILTAETQHCSWCNP